MMKYISECNIGICAPFDLEQFKPFFQRKDQLAFPTGLGGTAPTNIALELLRRGRRVSLFTLSKDVITPVEFHADSLSIYIGKYRLYAKQRALDFFRNERKFLATFIHESKPDIVNSHWTYEFALGSLQTHCPTVVTIRDAPIRILQLFPDYYRLIRLLMAYRVMKRAKHFTAVSPYLVEHVEKYFRLNKSLTVIPNGFGSHHFETPPHRENRSFDDPFVFFSIANGWTSLKNVKTLLKAFSTVRRTYSKTKLWLFGSDFEENGPAQIWAKQHGLDDYVEFFGKVSHLELLAKLQNSADALVHPSLEESFGNTLVEAMIFGVPVVAGKNSGAVGNTLGEGKAGLLVDVRDSQAIAKGMATLIHDPEYAKNVGLAGFHFASKHYDIFHVADQYEAVFEQILDVENKQ